MKGWQVGLCVVLLSGITVGRPRKLGASNRFPLFLGQQRRQGHSLLGHHGDHHQHHEHHEEPLPESRALSGLYSAPPVEAEPLDSLYSAPAEEVVPLDGLYGAPAEEVVPLDGLYGAPPPEVLPSYAEELPPAPSEPEPVKAAPAPAPMMMMDPSYNFEFTNDDSQRSETNDINGQLTGSYSYKTPGGEDIVVKYRAGADTGFVVDNMDELNAALERSAAEPSARADTLDSYGAPSEAVAQTYSGETAEIELLAPGVDENMNLENNYRYGYKTSDHQVSQEADSEGEVTGSYSYTMEDGKVVEVRYTAGKDGFRVENMEDVMATVHDDNQEDLGQYGNAAEVVVAKSAAIPNEDYNDYEPYVHEEIAAEPYVHQDMPYVHVDIPAEPYVHEEPVIAAKVAPPPVSAANTNKKSIGRRRVAVNKNNDHARDNVERSFSFEAKSDEHEFTEKADEAGERIGSYSYLTPEGDKITVRYSAGRNGFVILNPEEVLPQPVV